MPLVHPQRKPQKREIELDFIRGIAILLVLDFHMPRTVLLAPFAWLGYSHFGWAGVDIFFVLSGFLVGGLLIKEWQLKSRIDTKRFLIRRAFKIWPQYYFFLIAILLSGHKKLTAFWGNFLNVQNYTGGIAHTWTLAVEEHSYLLLLAILAFAAYKRIRMRTLFIFVALMALCVVIWRTILSARGVDVFTRTDTRIDGILYGLMLAMIYHYAPEVFRKIQGWTILWIGVVCFAVAYFRLYTVPSWNYWWSYDVSYICADAMGVALLLLLYKHREGRKRPALYRFIAWIGLYSYGIYLWHISVIAPSEYVAHRLPTQTGAIFLGVAPIISGIFLGVVTTKLIEFPALTLRDKLFPRQIDSAVGIAGQIEKDLDLHGPSESVSVDTPL